MSFDEVDGCRVGEDRVEVGRGELVGLRSNELRPTAVCLYDRGELC